MKQKQEINLPVILSLVYPEMIRRKSELIFFAVQEGFLIGLPFCRKLEKYIREIRSTIADGICCILFTIDNNTMILLHGFFEKTQKTPPDELKTARNRLAEYRRFHT
jgi:Phage-related protein